VVRNRRAVLEDAQAAESAEAGREHVGSQRGSRLLAANCASEFWDTEAFTIPRSMNRLEADSQ
jgi:hypothetical protein